MYVGIVALLVIIFTILMIVGVVPFNALVVGLLIIGTAVSVGLPYAIRA